MLPATHRPVYAPWARRSFFGSGTAGVNVFYGRLSCARSCRGFAAWVSAAWLKIWRSVRERRISSSLNNERRRGRPAGPAGHEAQANECNDDRDGRAQTGFSQVASALVTEAPAGPNMPVQTQQLSATFGAEVWPVTGESCVCRHQFDRLQKQRKLQFARPKVTRVQLSFRPVVCVVWRPHNRRLKATTPHEYPRGGPRLN